MQISKSVIAVGGVVLAAGLIGFTNPKTVHALVAALVQVTNTASNPVVTQSVGQQAGQMVHISCLASDDSGNCTIWPPAPNGERPPFVVPDGQSLVITAVDILPSHFASDSCTMVHEDFTAISHDEGSTYTGASWIVYNTSQHISYPSGMVLHSGASIGEGVMYPYPDYPNSCKVHDQIDFYGYLTAN